MVLRVSSAHIKRQIILAFYELFQEKIKENRRKLFNPALVASLGKSTGEESLGTWDVHIKT